MEGMLTTAFVVDQYHGGGTRGCCNTNSDAMVGSRGLGDIDIGHKVADGDIKAVLVSEVVYIVTGSTLEMYSNDCNNATQ